LPVLKYRLFVAAPPRILHGHLLLIEPVKLGGQKVSFSYLRPESRRIFYDGIKDTHFTKQHTCINLPHLNYIQFRDDPLE